MPLPARDATSDFGPERQGPLGSTHTQQCAVTCPLAQRARVLAFRFVWDSCADVAVAVAVKGNEVTPRKMVAD